MIKENLTKIQAEINAAISRRDKAKLTGEQVQLVTVSKTHPVETIREALAAGVSIFAENKVQEAAQKIPLLQEATWHLIGHLQTNKVRKAVGLFDVIYSVDSEYLLLAIDQAAGKLGKIQDILLQVNIAQEESKSGLPQTALPQILTTLTTLKNIRLRGLMVIAPESADAETVRPIFKEGYRLFCTFLAMDIKSAKIDMLSMGMSGDFKIAIEEGANNVRLGTAVFGKRDYSNA